jgi:hypothetical protein
LDARYGTSKPRRREEMEKVALVTGSTSNIGKAIAEIMGAEVKRRMLVSAGLVPIGNRSMRQTRKVIWEEPLIGGY